MRVRVKLCGVTRLEDVLLGIELGVDALGFNFVPGSPRRVLPEAARDLAAAVPPFVARVGVFVDEPPAALERTARMAGLTCLQLHGDESPEVCEAMPLPWYKVFRVGPDFTPPSVERYRSTACLLDAWAEDRRGGTGSVFDWKVARRLPAGMRVIVAGGLTPENVQEAIAAAAPYAVDVNSGVESAPGRKDRGLLSLFMQRVRAAAPRQENA